MHVSRILITFGSIFVLALMSGMLYVGDAQETQTRLATGNGNGTLRVGDEQFKITSAIVKLLPDHTAEITLVSEITIFLTATWSNNGESQREFDLDMTGPGSRGGVDGTGKASLSDDSKTLKRLTLKGTSRTTKRAVQADFEGK